MSGPIAGEFNTTPTTYGTGQKINIQTDSAGRLITGGAGTAGVPAGGVQSVQEVGALLTVAGTVSDAKVTNPDAATATEAGLLRGILNGILSTLPVQTYVSNSGTNITTKTTTVVKASPGTLARVTINKTGSADTLTIYDNTAGSGTVIATITSPTVGMNFVYDYTASTGITVVTGGTTAGDYTVTYR